MMKRRHRQKTSGTYGPLAELLASPIAPMPKALRLHQLTRMWQGLAAIEKAPTPTTEDWRVCSDAVNLMETLVDMGQVQDPGGLLIDAVAALAMAGKRHTAGGATPPAAPYAWTARASKPPAPFWKTTPRPWRPCRTGPWSCATASQKNACTRSWQAAGALMTLRSLTFNPARHGH